VAGELKAQANDHSHWAYKGRWFALPPDQERMGQSMPSCAVPPRENSRNSWEQHSRSAATWLFRRLENPIQVVRRTDQPHVSESLRKVAEWFSVRTGFFRVETQMVSP
jgi:hypothetical protein